MCPDQCVCMPLQRNWRIEFSTGAMQQQAQARPWAQVSAEALSALDEGWDSDATEPVENKDITEACPSRSECAHRVIGSDGCNWDSGTESKVTFRDYVSLLPV